MALETELKLRIEPAAISALLGYPLFRTSPCQQHLYNTYFDTDDLALTRQKVAVRERRVNGQTLLTVKTAGRSIDGLSQRQEWEAPTQPGAFDFRQLVDDARLADALARHADQLVPIFTTDFERLSWLITVNQGAVEVALDRGIIEVNRHGRTAHQSICELELELKSGEAAALTELAEALRGVVPLEPSDDSKAARGYALFNSLAT
jgi:inorganic triphosphatase YgiF